MSMNLSNIAIINIHGVDYRCFINGIRENGVLGLLNNVNPNDKSGKL